MMNSITARKPVRFEWSESFQQLGTIIVTEGARWGAKLLWRWKKRRTPQELFVETAVTFHADLVGSISAEAVIIPAPLPEKPTAAERWGYLLATLKSK